MIKKQPLVFCLKSNVRYKEKIMGVSSNMLYLFAIDYSKNLYYILDTNSGKVEYYHKKALFDVPRIENITTYGGQVRGRGYSLGKFSNLSENGRSYVTRQFISNGNIVAYEVIKSSGSMQVLNERDALIRFARLGVVNGEVRSGTLIMYKDTYKSVDTTPKTNKYKYDVDDYLEIFKGYKDLGLSHDKRKVDKYRPVFGNATLDDTAMQSNFDSLVEGHKAVTNVLNKSVILGAYPIYRDMTYGQGIKVSGLLGYTIKYRYKGFVHEVNIHKTDKKLMTLVKKQPVSKKDIENLWLYKESLPTDSAYTFIEMEDNMNVDELARLNYLCRQREIKLTLKDGDYKGGGISLKIRNNLRINCSEHLRMLSI